MTSKILEIITLKYIPEIGKPQSVVTDHGTQFRGRKWRDTLIDQGVKTYKTSVYHHNSNPAERVLRTYSVSYTHLDVYKRQLHDIPGSLFSSFHIKHVSDTDILVITCQRKTLESIQLL